ncbi:MAG: lipid A export permease/ATP-binding protein MsbA [Thiotrichaceae bacterium]|nr:lipid A export permease/ATP-binding protein MsbA [Thiotrichaceae bacterium]
MKIIKQKDLYLRLLGYIKPYIAFFIVGIISTILMASTQPAIAAMMKPLLDGAFVEKDQGYITWMPIVLIILFFIRGLTNFISTISFAWLSSKVVLDFRIEMFNKVLRLPTAFYDHNASGKIISKFTNDVTQVTASATDVLVTLIRDSVQVIGLIAWLFYLDWKLSLFIFALIPVIALVVVVVGHRLRFLSKKLQVSFGDLTHILGESLRGQKEVKMFGAQTYEKERFLDVANWVRRYQMKFRIASSISVPIVEMLGAFIMAYIIYLSTHRIEANQMTAGEFMSFFAALGLLLSPIKRLTKVNEPLQRSLAAAESVFGLIDKPAENNNNNSETHLKLQGNIQFKSIYFSYSGSEKPAINNLSLEIKQGQTIALVGSSGSGKTSLANLLPRLYEIQSGEILIGNYNIKDINLTTLRKHISLVSQDVMLFNDTLRANITYGTAKIDEDKLLSAITTANAKDFIDNMPNGLNTHIGENGIKLSGGQRQRIAIARAIYKGAPILILDEATSALDNESEQLVQSALDNLKKNCTTLVIAHRLSTIKKADRIIVMHNSMITESGTHKELLLKQGEYWKLQSSTEMKNDI